MEGFHTIKSILNNEFLFMDIIKTYQFPYYKVYFKLKQWLMKLHWNKCFHTIKSILNPIEFVNNYSFEYFCFHTIKSILNYLLPSM